MKTIKDILATRSLFNSTVWEDVVDYIRDVIDVPGETLADDYRTNVVDDVIWHDYGDYEVLPALMQDEETVSELFLTRTINAVIGTHAIEWKKKADALETEFNMAENVDEYSNTTTTYGDHYTDDIRAKRTNTDRPGDITVTDKWSDQTTETEWANHVTDYDYANHETETEYGARKTTDGAADQEQGIQKGQINTHHEGTRETNHYETTQNDVNNARLKTRDVTTTPQNGQTTDTIGAKVTTQASSTDTITDKQHKDTVTEKSRTDTVTVSKDNAHPDEHKTVHGSSTHEENPYTDTVLSHQHEDSVELHRHGNIGVIDVPTMLGKAWEFYSQSNLVKEIAQTIARAIGIAVWY